MDAIYQAAALSVAAIWLLGATTLIIWLVRVTRAQIKAMKAKPYTHPTARNFHHDDPQDFIENAADSLIQYAHDLGYVLTIETQPNPCAPLSMGNHDMVADVRPARERYQENGAA